MPAPALRSPTRVVAPPVGVSTRTRLRVSPAELTVLAAMVEHTTNLRNQDLRLAAAQVGRAERRKRCGDAAHTRLLDTMTADVNALVALRRRNLVAERVHLRGAVGVLDRRLAAPTKDTCEHAALGDVTPSRARPCPTCKDGYPTRNERHQKTRRRQVLTARLADVEARLAAGRLALLPGGRRRLRTRLHLTDAGVTEQAWRDEWQTARAWCGAAGSTGEHLGNRVFKLDPATGTLAVTVPLPVAAEHGLTPGHARAAGAVLTLAAPVTVTHHGAELGNRLANRLGVRFDLEPLYAGGRVVKLYLRASWTREQAPPLPTLETARAAGVLGVDLNADHLACHRVDEHGNPVGTPHTIGFDTTAPASLRDARLREAVVALLDAATSTGAGTIVVEDLGFTDPTTKETTGRGRRGTTFRRTVAGIPTAQLRHRLVAMAARRGITVICIDPHYTSKVAGKAWAAHLSGRHTATRSTTSAVVSRHHGAAVAIARRGLGMGLAPRRSRTAPHPRDGSRRTQQREAGAVTRPGGSHVDARTAQHGQPGDTGPAPAPPPTVVIADRPARHPTRAGGAHEYRPGSRGGCLGPKATTVTGRASSPTCHPC